MHTQSAGKVRVPSGMHVREATLAILLVSGTTAHATIGYRIVDLGVLPDAAGSAAYGLNDYGYAVGESGGRAFLWRPGNGMVALPADLPGLSSSAADINNAGTVVGGNYGWSMDGYRYDQAFSWDSHTQSVTRLYGGNHYQWSTAGINESGDIAGSGIGPWRVWAAPTIWTNDGQAFRELGHLPAYQPIAGWPHSYGYAINDSTHVVGSSNSHAFYWSNPQNPEVDTGLVDIGTLPGGSWSHATAINNLDHVAGVSNTATESSRAFLWTQAAGPSDLGMAPGYFNARVHDIDNHDRVVGAASVWNVPLVSQESRAVFWKPGKGMFDLNGYITQSAGNAWTLNEAHGINNAGQIVGTGTHNGRERAYIMSPGGEGPRGMAQGDMPDGSRPVVVITHGWIRENTADQTAWMNDLRQSVKEQYPDVDVLFWVWDDASAPGVLPSVPGSIADSFTRNVGLELGQYLREHMGQSTMPVQFIGHSLGTWVISNATRELEDNGIDVRQVTILDRPFALMPGRDSVERSMMFSSAEGGNLQGVERIENYYGDAASASTGNRLGNAVNTRFLLASHGDVHEEYRGLVGSEGFYLLGECRDCPAVPPAPTPGPMAGSTPATLFATNVPFDGDAAPIWNGQNNVTLSDYVMRLEERSPASAWALLLIPEGTDYLSFDMLWTGLGDGDYLTVTFNDIQLLAMSPRDVLGGYFSSGPVLVDWLAGQEGILEFMLNSMGDANASIQIQNLSFTDVQAVPLPPSALLFGSGLIGMLGLRRRHDT